MTMDDDKQVKVKILYGNLLCSHADMHARIIGPPEPRNRLEALWWVVQGLFYEVALPAFLFALAFVAFKFAILGHF